MYSGPIHLLHQDPVFWSIAALATLAETLADRAILRWAGIDARAWIESLVAVQLTTWIAIVALIDSLALRSRTLNGTGLLAMELMVVVAEVFLLRVVSALPRRQGPGMALPLAQACVLSVVGNLVSVGAAWGVIAALRWLAAD